MSSSFQQESLKIVVGHICQTIGYQGINTIPLNVLVDLLHRYLLEISGLSYKYCEHDGRTEPTVEDLGAAFDDLGISVSELEEYVNYVDPTPFPHSIPRIPIPKASNLNFLKPGSREILSRPLHIHEHLPPMYPEKEEEELNLNVDSAGIEEDALSESGTPPHSCSPSSMKRSSEGDNSPSKRQRFHSIEEGQPVREIDSVMMTTSGFISSAREGKLPEARKPNISLGTPLSDSPTSSGQALMKKKATMEKIFRHKNHQAGIFAGSMGGKFKHKDFKMKPKFPSTPPGTSGSLKPSVAKVAPKLKMPIPKIKMPPLPPEEEKKVSTSHEEKEEKKKKKDKNREPKPKVKEEGKHKEKKKIKEHKEGKRDRESKKIKESRKERSRKERLREEAEIEREIEKLERNKDRPRIRARGLTKEEELARYKAREMELIAALEASASVTVTTIPPPHLRVREQTPEAEERNAAAAAAAALEDRKESSVPSPTSPTSPRSGHRTPEPEPLDDDPTASAVSKLQIFRLLHKKGKSEKEGDKVQKSREGSPDLLIDDKNKDGDKTKDKSILSNEGPSTSGYPSPFVDDASPPATPTTPKTPEVVQPRPKQKSKSGKSTGPKIKDKQKEVKSRNKEKKSKPNTPSPRGRKPKTGKPKTGKPKADKPKAGKPKAGKKTEHVDRPKTPEEFSDAIPTTPTCGSFPIHLPNTPSFIPPFTRFPFIPPFVPGSARPPLADFHTISQMYSSGGGDPKSLEDDDHLERPITPRHEDESPTLAPTPETPPTKKFSSSISADMAAMSQTPERPVKSEKSEKKERKEHKKEKKEKEKEKKKKDKKNKEKAKEEKKREKEQMKLEKRKRGRKRKHEDLSSPKNPLPKITLKFQSDDAASSSSNPLTASVSPSENKPTPKVVIKPVVKLVDDVDQPKQDKMDHDRMSRRSISPPVSRKHLRNDEEDGDGPPPSPEIAKFSALITRPPKGKRSQSRKGHHTSSSTSESSTPLVPPLKIKDHTSKLSKDSSSSWGVSKDSSASKEASQHHRSTESVPPLKIKSTLQTPKIVSERKKSPSRKSEKKEKKHKRTSAAILSASETDVAGGIISPIVSSRTPNVADFATPKSSRRSHHQAPSAPTAHSTPLPPTAPPPSSSKTSSGTSGASAAGLLPEQAGPIGHFVDDQGNEVWICPTCGKQDDGSPMIGCDTCDDWYHWVCVGIQVPPSERENWYCPRCLSQHKQKGIVVEKKKRGRKRKII